MSTSTAEPARVTADSSRATGRRLIVFASLVGCAGLLVLGVFWFGHMVGEEFSPDTFEQRYFYYFEIPVVHLQVWPIIRTDVSNSLGQYLRSEGLLPAPAKLSQKEWHLSHLNRGTRLVRAGDAQILCSYLDTYDASSKSVWESWSETNVELAKILWPVLADLAREGNYILVPDVMEVAKAAADAEEFQAVTYRMLAERCEELGRNEQELGRHARGVRMFDAALRYLSPESASRSRIEALRDKARADSGQALLPAESPASSGPHAPSGS